MSDNRHLSTKVAYSSKHCAILEDYPIGDIDADSVFYEIFLRCRPFTMTSKDTMYSLYTAVRYVCARKLPGAFVECGVWKGGSALLAGLTMRDAGYFDREFYLYDTFEGMTQPSDEDIDISGHAAKAYIEQFGDDGKWCYEGIDAVKQTFEQNGFGTGVHYIKGDVLETLRRVKPEAISILRLDTDWYESTKFCLEALYDRIVPGGVLIIDDYGHWNGARKAVDEFFNTRPPIYLHRVNYAVRLGIKI
jgi:O-methyltransferase